MKLETLLSRGIEKMSLDVPAATRSRLLDFLRLLDKWNQAYNLTAVREIEQMVPKHLFDSLSVVPHVKGPHIVDIGTGAGLPGIPLACARPDLRFTLLDSNIKKIRFVRQVVHELGLSNVSAVHTAVQDYQPGLPFNTVIARALAAIPDMLRNSRHLLAPQGVFLAMKGVFPRAELAAVGEDFRIREVVALAVPELDAARHLVILERT